MDRPPRRVCAGLWGDVPNKAAPDPHAPPVRRWRTAPPNRFHRGGGSRTRLPRVVPRPGQMNLRGGDAPGRPPSRSCDQRSGRATSPGRARGPGGSAGDRRPRPSRRGRRLGDAGPFGAERGAAPGVRRSPLSPDPRGAPEPRRPRRVSPRLALPSTHHLRRGDRRDAGQGVGGRRMSSQQRGRATQRGGDSGREPTRGEGA